MRYLILGAGGQLGREFAERLGDRAVALERQRCDISDLSALSSVFESLKPRVVVNCAAYNRVDDAEKEFHAAYRVNALGVRNLAFLCRKHGAFLVHYSTDYVFDGQKEGLYTEDDAPNPINQYGRSKLTGEMWLREELEKHLIFRVSWVYGRGRQNFIHKLLEWSKRFGVLRVSCDEVSVPTSARFIVDATLKAVEAGLSGTYHLVCRGYASRYEWARRLFGLLGVEKLVLPVPAETFQLPAKRPRFSAMSPELFATTLGVEPPPWEEELELFSKSYLG